MPPRTSRTPAKPSHAPVGGYFRYIVGLSTATVLSMLIAFFFVQYLMRDLSLISMPDPARIAEAETLRQLSNDLLELSTEILARTSNDGASKTTEFMNWRVSSFTPRLKTLRAEIATVEPTTDLLGGLLRAADKLAAMSSNPDQATLRREAAHEVMNATSAAESWIAEYNLGQFLSEPGHIPSYGRTRD